MNTSFSINRIRLEFKASDKSKGQMAFTVLIESDWNLKSIVTLPPLLTGIVLIESDWNLKETYK